MERSNREVSFDHYNLMYREIDPQEAADRTGLDFDRTRSRFSLQTLGHEVYAQWPEFKLIPAVAETCPVSLYGFQMQILIMRVLCKGVNAPSCGKFKAYRELPWGDLYDTNFNGRCIKRFASTFGYKPDHFILAAEKLNGVRLDLGDVSFDFLFIGGITVRFILWTGDDEFSPSAQILFSDNSPLLYNAEDLVVICEIIIGTMMARES